jgi:hypothetical protein
MWARNLLAVTLIVTASPAVAGERLPPEEAIHFVAGKWWKFSCPYGLEGVGLVNKDGSIIAKAKANVRWVSALLWPFFGDGSKFATFRAKTITATPESICGNLIVSLCFTVEKLNDKQFIGYSPSRPFDDCSFQRTTAPPPMSR